jgi:hypothetical protein
MILELIEGPLLNPKRLDEAIRATKFIRRLFSFLHPYNNRFSSIKKTRVSSSLPFCLGYTLGKAYKVSQVINGSDWDAHSSQQC